MEKVEGVNVRGWEIRGGKSERTVAVSLLQPAKDHEQFTLRLWRAAEVGRGKPTRVDVPLVTVADAALQSGRLTIRRSQLIELRTVERSGVTRIDLPAYEHRSLGDVDGTLSPLGIRPFESYSFAALPFTIRLEAAPVEAKVSAVVDSILKLSEYARSLESRIRYDVRGRRIYRLRVLLPEGFSLETLVVPGSHEYTLTKQGRRPLLTVYLAAGQEGEVPLVVSGKLAAPRADAHP